MGKNVGYFFLAHQPCLSNSPSVWLTVVGMTVAVGVPLTGSEEVVGDMAMGRMLAVAFTAAGLWEECAG